MVNFHAQVGQGEKRGTVSSLDDRRGGGTLGLVLPPVTV